MIEIDAEQAQMEALTAKLEAFGNSLKRKRDEAVAARKASGIEEEWTLAEEAYQGIDDATRGNAVGKPSSPYGGYVNAKPVQAGRSTVLLNITRPYVDAAAARVGDMLLPTDDRNWCIKITPLGDAKTAGDNTPEELQVLKMIDADRQKAADGAQKQIEDWLVECQWHSEVRKLIEDCARLGTGVLKGPVPAKRLNRVVKQGEGMMAYIMEEKIAPESRCISPWNLYPDGDCGECIHDGAYIWEKDSIVAKKLKDLRGLPGYLDEQIEKVLEQGPQGKHSSDFEVGNVKAKESDVFEIWYYHGAADREDLLAAGVDLDGMEEETIHCVLTMVNDVVIKAALNPLDSGDFPYDVMPWQRKTNHWAGTGVGMQINTPQRMLTAAVRNLMDNAGLTAGPQLIMRRNAIVPADGQWTITPRKIWWVNEDADVAAVNQAFLAVNIPTMQQELNNIMQFAMKMAEDVTGLPMLMQGQAGAATPDTVGGMQMLNNNASSVLRRIARLFDDRITEPHIRRYYDWLMMYGEDDSIKGDFQIDARGSTALVERDLQNQAIMQMGALVMNPAFGIDPEKWIKETLKAQRLDPERFQMDEDKKKQMAEQAPPPPPQIQAAQIRAQADMQKTQMELEADMQKAQMQYQASVEKMRLDTDRDTVYVQAQQARDQTNAQAKMVELQLKREIAMLQYATQEKISLDRAKTQLAEAAMKLQTTKELAGVKAPASALPTPPIEPPGIAPRGESFQK